MAARALFAVTWLVLVSGLAACDSTSPKGGGTSCGSTTGVEARLQSDQAFTAADVDLLRRRVTAAGATCLTASNAGSTSLDLKVFGIARARGDLLLAPGNLTFVTWVPAGQPITAPPASVAARYVPTAEGGTCAGSTATVECIPTGYVPHLTGVGGAMITSAAATQDRVSRQPSVEFVLNAAGTALLAAATVPMPANPPPLNQLAIFLDDSMINNASVQSPLTNGQVQVSGGGISSDAHYAADLAAVLNTPPRHTYTVTSITDIK